MKNIKDYLSRIPCNLNSMVMQPTTQYEVEKLIKDLPNKESRGHDMISNTLLKSLGNSISLLLTILIYQSISEGIFPDQMKIAEIIPLYKGKGSNQLINYRPISLLLTMSKQSINVQLNSLTNIKYYMTVNMDLL